MSTNARCSQCGQHIERPDPVVLNWCERCVSALEWRGEQLEREAREDKAGRLCVERSRLPLAVERW